MLLPTRKPPPAATRPSTTMTGNATPPSNAASNNQPMLLTGMPDYTLGSRVSPRACGNNGRSLASEGLGRDAVPAAAQGRRGLGAAAQRNNRQKRGDRGRGNSNAGVFGNRPAKQRQCGGKPENAGFPWQRALPGTFPRDQSNCRGEQHQVVIQHKRGRQRRRCQQGGGLQVVI